MGANYYLVTDEPENCSECGQTTGDYEKLHIGKSSAGWCFGLHVIEDLGLNSLDDWMPFLEEGEISSEYGDIVSCKSMLALIKDRSRNNSTKIPMGYSSWDEFHRLNHSIDGPCNLLRSAIDGSHCVGHGEGTWDLIASEFS